MEILKSTPGASVVFSGGREAKIPKYHPPPLSVSVLVRKMGSTVQYSSGPEGVNAELSPHVDSITVLGFIMLKIRSLVALAVDPYTS